MYEFTHNEFWLNRVNVGDIFGDLKVLEGEYYRGTKKIYKVQCMVCNREYFKRADKLKMRVRVKHSACLKYSAKFV